LICKSMLVFIYTYDVKYLFHVYFQNLIYLI
jgi:hypothetical protein